jgi:hypothetical protein
MTDDGYLVPNRLQVKTLIDYLDNILSEFSDILIIHGEAKGADSLAKDWAKSRNIEQIGFPAQWDKYGKSAGFFRNTEMLKVGKPDIVVAFPGGPGTAMMCKIAEAEGVEVRKVV